MNKQVIAVTLKKNYSAFADYIMSLTESEYGYVNEGKWNAAQQLQHIVLCVQPLVYVFSQDKPVIEQNYGREPRQSRSYDMLLGDYLGKLHAGGKAPERFLPAQSIEQPRIALIATLTKLIDELCAKLLTFDEAELDSLLIPHPLLGKLTLREMLYNAIYHVGHHKLQVQQNLQK